MNSFPSTIVPPARALSRSMARFTGRFAVLATLCAASAAWSLPTVSYLATDLADVTAGEDLWRYDYSVAGPLGEFESVNLLFVEASYSSLSLVSNDAEVDVALTASSLGLDGQATVTAFVPLAVTPPAKVALSFVWLGAGAPGSQAFEHLDDGFSVIETGVTTAVPEPATLAMLLAGLGLLAPLAAARRRT